MSTLHLYPGPNTSAKFSVVRRHFEKGVKFLTADNQPVTIFDIPKTDPPRKVVIHVAPLVTFRVTVRGGIDSDSIN